MADARKLSKKKVLELIHNNTDQPSLGFLGDPGVNVLMLNIAMDKVAPLFTRTGRATSRNGGDRSQREIIVASPLSFMGRLAVLRRFRGSPDPRRRFFVTLTKLSEVRFDRIFKPAGGRLPRNNCRTIGSCGKAYRFDAVCTVRR